MRKHIKTDRLDIAYHDTGPENGPAVILLHGFPYDASAYFQVAEALSDEGLRCIIPYLRGFGETRFLTANIMRSGQQAAIAQDLLDLMNTLSINRAVLAGYDWGGRAACIVSALWPERVTGLVSCGEGYNIQNIPAASEPAFPDEEHLLWYIHYMNTERGRKGLTAHREAFCRKLWVLWSPSWAFDDATFARAALSFDNPDFIDIVIHSYRHRLGNAPGDPIYAELEQQLARQPKITVPTIILQGQDDGVDPPSASAINKAQFTSLIQSEIVPGTGHNLPQESPKSFVEAILTIHRQHL
ncbi:alpha/beta fold hydrolase [Coralliovum pocilloporae]|uniref:alpha/beta fold hydrolase n=1 Tax=Coralliovum pocilloporae TaxID=3066369 RepID=UPI003307094D